jgi:hypothetical protein
MKLTAITSEQFDELRKLVSKPKAPKKAKAPIPTKIHFSNKATVVFWDDDTKTVVKCMKGDTFDHLTGVAYATTKKIYGSNTKFKRLVEKFFPNKLTSEGLMYGLKSFAWSPGSL